MGRKKKLYKPCEDKFEYHPWVRFPTTNNQGTHLIIGSFPPNKFTTHREKLTKNDCDFFYGSRDNKFWELFINSIECNIKWPDCLHDLKQWLYDNKWIVTDIVLKTKRKKVSAFDSDLIEIEWNIKTIDDILRNNPVKYIFFTSCWVEQNYNAYISQSLTTKREIVHTILISPSKNGLRSLKRRKDLAKEIKLIESPKDFRIRFYKEKLSLK